MDKPMAALRECSWDMVQSWGLNIEQQRTLTRKVTPKDSPSSWFLPDDYPTSMLRAGRQAIEFPGRG